MSIPGSRLGIPSAPGTSKRRRIPNMPIAVTVGAAGTATFTWPGVPADEIWTGAASVPLATPSSVLPILWSAFDGGTPIGQWYNSQSSSPLQVRTQLQVTGSSIAAATLVAQFQGIATDIVSAPPWWPAPTPAPPPSGPFTLINTLTGAPTPLTSNGITTIVSKAPVVVGTSLEIEFLVLGSVEGVNGQIDIDWAPSPTASDAVGMNFDIYGNPGTLSGWIIPNLDSFVDIFFRVPAATTPVLRLKVLTGLPPIVRSPIMVPDSGTIGGAKFVSIPAGETTINLPPYVGSAMLSAELLNATVTQLDARIESADYAGNHPSVGPWFVSNQVINGNTATIGGPLVYLPPRINTLVLGNRTGAPQTGSWSLTALGP